MRQLLKLCHRRAFLAGICSLACSSTCNPRVVRSAPIDEASLEGRLIAALQTSSLADAKALVVELESLGGSQKQLAEGPGSFEIPWIGGWDLLYSDGAVAGPLATSPVVLLSGEQVKLRLSATRAFVYGPTSTTEDLKGRGLDGSASIERIYTVEPAQPLAPSAPSARPPSILLARSGSITKLPDYAYRIEFRGPARAYAVLGEAAGEELQLPTGALSPAVAATERISYLSERLWLSRGSGDELTVLRRSDARALAPPPGRPDLTAPCSDAPFPGRTEPLCRQRAMF